MYSATLSKMNKSKNGKNKQKQKQIKQKKIKIYKKQKKEYQSQASNDKSCISPSTTLLIFSLQPDFLQCKLSLFLSTDKFGFLLKVCPHSFPVKAELFPSLTSQFIPCSYPYSVMYQIGWQWVTDVERWYYYIWRIFMSTSMDLFIYLYMVVFLRSNYSCVFIDVFSFILAVLALICGCKYIICLLYRPQFVALKFFCEQLLVSFSSFILVIAVFISLSPLISSYNFFAFFTCNDRFLFGCWIVFDFFQIYSPKNMHEFIVQLCGAVCGLTGYGQIDTFFYVLATFWV